MLKEHATLLRRLMIVADLAIVALSFLTAYRLRNAAGPIYPISDYTLAGLFLLVVWGVCLSFSGMYESFRLKKSSELLFLVYQSAYIGFFLFVGLCYLFHLNFLSRTLIVITFLITAGLLAVEKLALSAVFRRLRKRGFNYRNLLVIGTGARAQHLLRSLDENRDLGLRTIGVLDYAPELVGQDVCGHRVLGVLADLPRIVRENVVDQVVFVAPRSWLGQIEMAVQYLEKLGIRVDIEVSYFNVAFTRARQSDFLGMQFLSFDSTPSSSFSLILKRIMDMTISAAALIVLSPLFLVVAAIIKLTSPGPVFFMQKRVSMNGRTFNLYKFRTMVADAEARLAELKHLNEMQGPVFKIEKDPRITPVGAFLRKTSIDELPQLWNVLRGDMSLVGPRPPLPSEVNKYDDWQRRRLSMRPGITCLWQIKGRNRITDFEEWAALDLKYIDNWSLWLDVEILFRTVPVVLFRVGAK